MDIRELLSDNDYPAIGKRHIPNVLIWKKHPKLRPEISAKNMLVNLRENQL